MKQKVDSYLIDVLNKRQKKILYFLLFIWLVVNSIFWAWWFRPEHVAGPFFFWLNTTILAATYLTPLYLFFFVSRMKKPNPAISLSENWQVAMITTKVPSEPLSLLKKTLKGMLDQSYPHDTWLADEDSDRETIDWCRQNGVKVSCRKGVAGYQQEAWPRRRRCKEGNLAYFYDKYGYDNYDFVCQLDADHVPEKGYLEKMIQPFIDSKIGYVSAPSICSRNADRSWVARARLYAEGFLHGAQQAGHTNGFAPLCFGSHYAVRTKALREIGGLGPELAEDHSTTLIMNAGGWRGVHALDALAIGDGPDTFADAMTQEFQWSRSLTNILLMWTPKYLKSLPFRLKIQFLFSQLWYPIYSFTLFLGLLVPIVALFSGQPMVKVAYPAFFLLNIINIFSVLIVVNYLRGLNLCRPQKVKILSWETFLFNVVKWPWSLFGVISSVSDFISKNEFKFKVTPKDKDAIQPLPAKAIFPYVLVISGYLAVGYLSKPKPKVQGYLYFVLLGTLTYILALLAIVFLHKYEQIKSTNK